MQIRESFIHVSFRFLQYSFYEQVIQSVYSFAEHLAESFLEIFQYHGFKWDIFENLKCTFLQPNFKHKAPYSEYPHTRKTTIYAARTHPALNMMKPFS